MSISEDPHLYHVKLSSDERFLIFDSHDGEGETLNPIDLCRIQTIDSAREENGKDKEDSKLSLLVRETATDEVEYGFTCPQEPSRKPSLEWIDAFKQGMVMVFESRSFCRDPEEDSNSSETTTPTSD